MTDKPLPDRIRPLEGAGLYNMVSTAERHGFTRKRDRLFGPTFAVLGTAFICWMLWELIR